MTHYIAQFNIGRMVGPLDSPALAAFADALDEVNALADAAPGFVWRFAEPGEADATGLRLYADDALMIVNFSVWASLDELWNFVYRSDHLDYLRRRREWFELIREPIAVLWWVEAGVIPTPEEGMERLELLRRKGPTPEAFTFKERFPAP